MMIFIGPLPYHRRDQHYDQQHCLHSTNSMTFQRRVTVILDNVRSLYNVGAVLRACDGAGVTRVITCGITPYASQGRADQRRGPVAARADRELRKTALAAFDSVHIETCASVEEAIERVRAEGATLVAVEAKPGAPLYWESPALDADPLAFIFGHEVEGIGPATLSLADATVRIPMSGVGASLNVAIAAALVLYELARRSAYTDPA